MAAAQQTKGSWEFGPYRLDPNARVLFRGREIVPLTPKVLDTLVALVEHAGQLVSKEELLPSVWPDSFVEESNLAQNIAVLRKMLGKSREDGPFIETISKRGYRFVAVVRAVPAVEPPPASEPGKTLETLAPATESESGTPPKIGRRVGFIILLTMAATLICGAVGFWNYRRQAAAPPPIRSLAVLPLKNLSGDAGQDYLADGITELLTTELSQALPLRVTSGTSAMRYRDSTKTLATIAAELKVDAVVEGSVARSGDRLRLTVQLIQARTDRHVWAETYDRTLTDAMLLQEEVARAVAREIKMQTPTPEKHGTQVNREAFDDFLRARYYLNERNAHDVRKAVDLYQKAIAEDPAFALPYAGLADSYNQQGTVMIGSRSPAEGRKLAMAAAKRALEIDPNLAEAHAALAYSNLYEWNWGAAYEGFERAIKLNPNYPFGHLWLGHYYFARGNVDRGLQEAQLACDLDPLSEIMETQKAWLLGGARRHAEAIQIFEKVLADHPNYQWALWQLGSQQMATHNYDAAIETLKKAVEVGKGSPSALGTLGQAYGLAGRKGEAQEILAELTRQSHERYVPPHAFVHVYIGLGDKEKAFEWLERSYQERSNSMVWMGTTALYDPLRSDPRFESLLRRVGLKPGDVKR
jgi:TolB-like protein/DNA-binding winged helix-turn-helix (wHTH) protein/Tfp pilus assembly protein PilF